MQSAHEGVCMCVMRGAAAWQPGIGAGGASATQAGRLAGRQEGHTSSSSASGSSTSSTAFHRRTRTWGRQEGGMHGWLDRQARMLPPCTRCLSSHSPRCRCHTAASQPCTKHPTWPLLMVAKKQVAGPKSPCPLAEL